MNRSFIQASCAILFTLLTIIVARGEAPPTTAQSSEPQESAFDPTDYALGDFLNERAALAEKGIKIEPQLAIDYSKNFMGGLDTDGDSFREVLDLPITVNTKIFGIEGGQFVAEFQLQHGGDASKTLTGDAQNFAHDTNADGRSQLGKLYYQQTLPHTNTYVRIGKMDASDDFDNLANASNFLNNSFSSAPTIMLLPSFPDTAMGIEIFHEPASGFYAGAGLFDGSQARGVHTGEYGPSHFLDRGDNLFLIAEAGEKYAIARPQTNLPGRLGVGGWWNTNPFERLDNTGQKTGTGGVYVILDQTLHSPPNPDSNPPGKIDSCFSISWCDPIVNQIDGNVLGGVTEIGPLECRPRDIAGIGATLAHFSPDADTRDGYELAIELFYRIQIANGVALEPDLQYIIHPSGSGMFDEPVRDNALVATLRLEIAF